MSILRDLKLKIALLTTYWNSLIKIVPNVIYLAYKFTVNEYIIIKIDFFLCTNRIRYQELYFSFHIPYIVYKCMYKHFFFAP